MKSKIKKFLKPLAIGLFFIALFFNLRISMEDSNILLDNAVIAQTFEGGEKDCKPGGQADKCCPYWNVTYPSQGPSSCTTGGQFKCNTCSE
jgi:hypothetical protein